MSGPGLEAVGESACVHCAATVALLKSPFRIDAPALWVHLPTFARYCDLTATPEQPRDADGDPIWFSDGREYTDYRLPNGCIVTIETTPTPPAEEEQ